jgi:hypothetical protein
LERRDVGVSKGGPDWVRKIRERTGLAAHQHLYIGDSLHDMVTATRGPMLYAHAMWSPGKYEYGLQASSPAWAVNVTQHIFRKRHPWYWLLDVSDNHGRPVRVRSLIDGNGAGSWQTKDWLLGLLKDDLDRPIPGTPMLLSEFVMLHLLSSVYDENLFGGSDLWTTYPGHSGNPNVVMGRFLDVATKLSRDAHAQDLFVRHTPAKKSKQARDEGGREGALRNQLETTRIGAPYRGRLAGKRVLLFDNFLTYGYSTENARNLAMAAGASEVVVATVGKYGDTMNVVAPVQPWDALFQSPPDAVSFTNSNRYGRVDEEALGEFADSLNAIRAANWL